MTDNSIPWLIEAIRLTSFPGQPISPNGQSWWSDVIGSAPDRKLIQPKSGELIEEGQFASGRLILRLTQPKIDWTLVPLPDKQSEEMPPTIGNYPEMWQSFLPVTKAWVNLPNLPPIKRIAFGSVLLKPVETPKDGYTILSGLLHSIKLDPDAMVDFFYQINRPRVSASGVPDLAINRLSKWGVVGFQDSLISIGPEGIIQKLGPERYIVRIELDINTSQKYQKDLEQKVLPSIIDELLSMAHELVDRGDVQ